MGNELFAKLIKDFRKNNRLTQDELVHIIMLGSDEFYGLDTVTISRWENNVTSPLLYRKLKVAQILGFDWYKHTLNNLVYEQSDIDIFSVIKAQNPPRLNFEKTKLVSINELPAIKAEEFWK